MPYQSAPSNGTCAGSLRHRCRPSSAGISQDITGHLAQEHKYSCLIDTTSSPIFGVDMLGRVNVWNECASQLIGYSKENVMG
jgi:hypothetical protein